MSEQPDKFFREKLEGYRPSVPAGAWNRVSDELRPTGGRMLWLKIAAGLLLLAVAGVLLVEPEKQNPPSLAVEKETPPAQEGSHAPDRAAAQPETPEGIARTPSPVARQDIKAETGSKVKKMKPRSERVVTDDPRVNKELAAADGLQPGALHLPQEKRFPSPVTSPASRDREQKNITIIFSAREVDEKYLTKKNTVAEATSEEEDASSWRKLLDKAYDLKHNQDPIGNLRQKKNEILAFNFKSEKEKP